MSGCNATTHMPRFKYVTLEITSSECDKVSQAEFFSSIKMSSDFLLALSAARNVQNSVKSTVVQHHVSHGHCAGWSVTARVTSRVPCYVTEQRTS